MQILRSLVSLARRACARRVAAILPRSAASTPEWQRAAMATTFALLFAAGGLIALLSLVVGDDPGRDDRVVAVVGVAAVLGGLGLFVGFDRLPLWAFHAASAMGSVMVAVAIVHGGDAAIVYVLFYGWVGLYAAYFYGPRGALAHIALAAVTFAAASVFRPAWLSPLYSIFLLAILATSVAIVFYLKWREDVLQRDLLASQDELRHAQKLEAVGRLAGGIAHDFNNLLTGILGYGELLAASLPADDPRRGDIDEIVRASERAADLTRQLLAFSRRQVLEPSVFDAREALGSILPMLRRLIGEDVALTTDLASDPLPIRADRAQFEQVIVNLVLNARDAVPTQGGTIAVSFAGARVAARERHGLAPGSYAVISVTDNGTGIPPEIIDHVFDPFFTTKDIGKGTGLGLSMAHGFVAQSGGHIEAESAPGGGTTFRVYLPCVVAASPAGDAAPAADRSSTDELRSATR